MGARNACNLGMSAMRTNLSICGGSGCGKSTLAEVLRRRPALDLVLDGMRPVGNNVEGFLALKNDSCRGNASGGQLVIYGQLVSGCIALTDILAGLRIVGSVSCSQETASLRSR